MSESSKLASPPFAPGGEYAVDAEVARRLLSLALERGGDYADLYFEYRVSADYVLEDEQVKAVGRGISMGLGVRVLKGDATGYAYSEDLSFERMAHAARMAGQIAAGGGTTAPVAVTPVTLPDFYPVGEPSLGMPPEAKLALLRAADQAARSFDPRISKVEASLVEQVRELLVVTSDGSWAQDRQPLIRMGVRAVAEDGDKRQSGSSGGGGRHGLDYFTGADRDAAWHGREAARIAIAM